SVRADARFHQDALRPAPASCLPPRPPWTASRDRAAAAAPGEHPIDHLVAEPTRFVDRDKAGRPRARTLHRSRPPAGATDALSPTPHTQTPRLRRGPTTDKATLERPPTVSGPATVRTAEARGRRGSVGEPGVPPRY